MTTVWAIGKIIKGKPVITRHVDPVIFRTKEDKKNG